MIGGKTYDLLRNLLSPTDPKDKSFNELVETLKGHFEPKPIVNTERFHFYKRSQADGESVAQFIAELRRLARHCEFKTFLEEALGSFCMQAQQQGDSKLPTEEERPITNQG